MGAGPVRHTGNGSDRFASDGPVTRPRVARSIEVSALSVLAGARERSRAFWLERPCARPSLWVCRGSEYAKLAILLQCQHASDEHSQR